MENVVQCASNGYTLGFAYPYCMKSAENQHKFDENVCIAELTTYKSFALNYESKVNWG